MATRSTDTDDVPSWGETQENGEWEPVLMTEEDEGHESPFPANEEINSKVALWCVQLCFAIFPT